LGFSMLIATFSFVAIAAKAMIHCHSQFWCELIAALRWQWTVNRETL
jgi:hypothetical protein